MKPRTLAHRACRLTTLALTIALSCGPRPSPVPTAAAALPTDDPRGADRPEAGALAWLALVDRRDYLAAWAAAHNHGSREVELPRFEQSMAAHREPLGAVVSRTLASTTPAATPSSPGAARVQVRFDSVFEHDQPATEMVTMTRQPDGTWKMNGYFVQAVCSAAMPPPSLLPAPPAALGLDPFYRKYVDAGGIPVVGSERVADGALLAARDIVQHLLRMRPDARDGLIRARVRVAVMAPTEQTLDLPEQAEMAGTPTDTPGVDWNDRARGLGGSIEIPVTSTGEENLLCLRCDRYAGENTLIHEFGHAIEVIGLVSDAAFQKALHDTYDAAVAKGLWKGTYAGSNEREYWAEGTQDWFDAFGGSADEGKARAELATYDPALHALLARVYPDDDWRYACAQAASVDVAAAVASLPAPTFAIDATTTSPPASCPSGMVPVGGGSFLMGYPVTVRPFCIDATEVTVARYAACARAGRCTPAGTSASWKDITDDERATWSPACNGDRRDRQAHPVNCVDADQAERYCRAQGKRLPTEAEWEWAARGGSRGALHPWGNAAPGAQLGWSGVDKREGTSAVGSFPGGDAPGGIHDLVGNVWEMTRGAKDGEIVGKGSGYDGASALGTQVAQRVPGERGFRGPNTGFRCVK